ncbi:MAG TPA: bifunctional 4-hydroxy-2-oxoglutarate aldolase/2-dehydro-3-deoxy-phosphogluconate aldolase [Caulobacteraceae bacterium]|jgi:2-dehydro-3-deoxyphosphogluconate aldolase/(4S)-4-hydroxy-2-oxoglutarate aldolase|nr:bifunctional 4-hydroxy-2-oxoglutarate aldolase/2-dehydro-3-deoxy-phosphogluconate aldolase [Caulobacteraceae bacterium]
MTIDDILAAGPVMPVVVIDDAAHAVPLARALVAGGIRAIEITLRTGAALDAIQAISRDAPGAIPGVGTALTGADVLAALEAGARFIVSPGCTPALTAAAVGSGLPFLPGVATASELMAGMEAGLSAFKFFPAAQAGGVEGLKALAGPFPKARFCPTGGVGEVNAAEYLALPNVVCVGGSWIAPRAAIAAGDFATIEGLARAAARLATA